MLSQSPFRLCVLLTAAISVGTPLPADAGEQTPPPHWAFIRIERPPVPHGSAENPIDAFLSVKQDELGLKQQPQAERSIRLRRLYLDLLGLPPTLEQLHDTRPWGEIVDELLANPLHGERWARHWMDVWRYSDWYGLDEQLRNSQKHIWHWRDWIVESLNTDKGYDRMIMEMLAGDELAPTDMDVVRATGFLARNYYLFNRTTWLDDTIEHTAKAFVGLTLNCAKCHDHKYDPVTQEDYYRFRAIFEPHQVRLDTVNGELDFKKDGIPRVFDEYPDAPTWLHLKGDEKNPDKTRTIEPGVPALLANFATEPEPITLPYAAFAPGAREAVHAAHLENAKKALASQQTFVAASPEPDFAVSDSFDAPNDEIWRIEGDSWEYRDGSLFRNKIDQSNELVELRQPPPADFEATLRYAVTEGAQWKSVGLRFDRTADGRQKHQVYTSAHEPDPKVQVMHTEDGKDRYPQEGYSSQSIKVDQTYELKIAVRQTLLNVWLDGKFILAYRLPARHPDGRIAFAAFDCAARFESIGIRSLPADVELKEADNKVADAEMLLERVQAVIAADRAKIAGDPNFSVLAKKAAELQGKPDYQPLAGSMKALETPEHKFEQYPSSYSPTSTGRRLALAKWIVHRDNPLTARVAVNHVWMRHFGEPLVETVADFGVRAKRPEHQELLDWLAAEFVDSGWSFRHLHRLMVTSEAYQRSSTNAGAEINTLTTDRENHYYWRMNSTRMDAQSLRDSLLYFAGDLDLKIGGPSIDPGKGGTRRSMYFLHSRDHRDKFLGTFDDADHLQCYRRLESIKPQQALAMANSRLAIDLAGKIASQIHADAFADTVFALLLGRRGNADELAACAAFLATFEQPETGRSRLVQALLSHNDFITVR